MENYKTKLVRYLKDNATTKKAEILKSIEDYKACIKISTYLYVEEIPSDEKPRKPGKYSKL